ncbi:MAG TPA: hypothetical protein DIT28_10070 [Oxalobacteraceae bacterium]|nr:hypothetical protein [Oxalobacteraceae bacterium]
MGDFARMTVTGIGDLKAKFDALNDDLKERALRSAGYAGARLICDQAIENAPYYTGEVSAGHPPPGTLKNSIIVKRIEEQSGIYRQTYYITVRRGKAGSNVDAYYAHMVEYGHFARGSGQALKGGARSKASQRVALAAAGAKFIPAQSFMRTAFEMQKSSAIQAIEKRLGTFITFAAK